MREMRVSIKRAVQRVPSKGWDLLIESGTSQGMPCNFCDTIHEKLGLAMKYDVSVILGT